MKTTSFLSRLMLVLTLALGGLFGLTLNPNPTPVQAAPTWALQWSDEFNAAAGTGLNTSQWIYDIGHGYGCAGCPWNWGTGEIEYNTNSTANVYHDGAGRLAIKPIRDAAGNWTSGRIETQRLDFQPPAGQMMAVEASLQLPNVSGAAAQGYWPAFWMLGAPFRGVYTNWPGIGEIDIMENVNGQNTEYGTLHCGTNPGGPCNETSGIGGSTPGGSPSLQTAFHTYRIEFDRSVSPEEIRWYLDGVKFHTVKANQVDATTWTNATNHGFFIILNVAIGGGWPGGPTGATTSGVPMLVDYVRVYYSTNTGTPVPTTVPPTATQVQNGAYTHGAERVNASQVKVWLKPNTGAFQWAILHYNLNGGAQQNLNMTYNTSAARWEYTVSGVNASNILNYSFTYFTSVGYDTPWYSYSGGTPAPTATTPPPTATPSGAYSYGAVRVNANTATLWIKPNSGTFQWAIVHYTVNNGGQQNLNMTYNTSTARWEYTLTGLSAGSRVNYSFTYFTSVGYDTGWYTYTH